MKKTSAALLAGVALLSGAAANAGTIDTHAFTFTTDSSLVLLSESANTAQIQFDSLTWNLDTDLIESGGSAKYSMFDAVVKDGYRIVSFTLSAQLTGTLDVTPLDPGCGSAGTFCTPGSATNRAQLRWVTTDLSAEAIAERNDFAGQEMLTATNAQPLSLEGEFRFVTETTLYVSHRDGEIYRQGSDWSTTTYLPSRATIGFDGPVVLTVEVAAVPEPGPYAMLLAGLGLLGWAARGKRRPNAA